MVDLGSTVAGRSSRANGISGDGKIVVGWQEHTTGPRQGARWVDGKQEMFAGPDGFVGEAHGANSDGSIIVGQTCRILGASRSKRVDLDGARGRSVRGRAAPAAQRAIGIMFSTSEDGRVIGGAHSFGLESEAVLWIDRSPSYLKDYLKAHGVPTAFDGWVNTGFITGVSPDGRILVGYGAGPRDFQGYIVIWEPRHEPPRRLRRVRGPGGVSDDTRFGRNRGRPPAWSATRPRLRSTAARPS